MTDAFIIFHLNLAYSSIPESARRDVISRCYWPLLQLIKSTRIPIGVELTSWTLAQILKIEPDWVNEFKQLVSSQECEVIGSGYAQLIGPLVPYEVNKINQEMGMEDYQNILGEKPHLALVNEMAFSTSLVEIYKNVGYQGILMDRDNVRLALNLENDYEGVPSHAMGLNQSSIPILWTDSILFQKLQRYTHGETVISDYLEIFKKRKLVAKRPLAIYCNDAEIFDFRPGRYREESPAHQEGEWKRLEKLLGVLTNEEKVQWLSPSRALVRSLSAVPQSTKMISSISQPIPVKKQAKYNVSRWAITGRGDLWINTMCYRIARALKNSQQKNNWRRLCEAWQSDLRTHITEDRWKESVGKISHFANEIGVSQEYVAKEGLPLNHQTQYSNFNKKRGPFHLYQDPENIRLTIESSKLSLTLNLRKGLTIQSLSFSSHDFQPCLGTLPHGYFDCIEYGADFYSGGVVLESPVDRIRVTDLERTLPSIELRDDALHITGHIHTPKGIIVKSYILKTEEERIELSFEFPDWKRCHSVIRVGNMTLLPEAFRSDLFIKTYNGGSDFEYFKLENSCDHTKPVSSLVSCTTGFGATTGEIIIGDQNRKIKIKWDPAECAAFPMLFHKIFKKKILTRICFSLSELDETMRPGGELPPFRFQFTSSME